MKHSKDVGVAAAEDVEHEEDLKSHVLSTEEAQAANLAEHQITLKQALRENWKAVLWSAVISLTIVMEGYDQRYQSSIRTRLCD